MPKHPKRTPKAQPAPRPSSVKVGFYEYAIIWATEEEWLSGGFDVEKQGTCDANGARLNIRITPNVHEQILRETLLHEIIHAIWWTLGLREFPIKTKDLEASEEEMVLRLTHPLLAVIQENPDVMAYLGAQLWKVKVRG